MSELDRQRRRVAGSGTRPVVTAEDSERAHAIVEAWLPRMYLPGALLELRGLVAAGLADTRAEVLALPTVDEDGAPLDARSQAILEGDPPSCHCSVTLAGSKGPHAAWCPYRPELGQVPRPNPSL